MVPSTYFENYFCSNRQQRIPKTFVKPHFTLDKNDPNSYMMVGNSIVYSPNKEENRSRNVATCNKCQRRQYKEVFSTYYPFSNFCASNSTCHSTKTHYFRPRNTMKSLFQQSNFSLLAKIKKTANENKTKSQSLSVSSSIPKKYKNGKRMAKTFYGTNVNINQKCKNWTKIIKKFKNELDSYMIKPYKLFKRDYRIRAQEITA